MSNITPGDHARRLAVENEVLRLRDTLNLAGPAVALDLASRAVHAGAEVTSVGVRMPCGSDLAHWLSDLRADPAAAHFWRREPEAKPTPAKQNFDGVPRKRRATAKLDSANGVSDEVKL